MGSVFNVVNLSVINNTVDGSDVRKDAWIFWGTWLLPKVCRGLPLLKTKKTRHYNTVSSHPSRYVRSDVATIVRFPRIFCALSHTSKQLPDGLKGYYRPSTDLHLDQLASLDHAFGITEPVLPISSGFSSFPVWLSRYHCYYGVEFHEQK
ncbi:hypothetical protein T4D_15310 [Trichinella pseudospiralis]|uniref:Uncharacterized protein n=1 Tax=Trichinella pseudospiralis TaxID=6337 RepID=A0A0V1G1S1_TRIPS|nr:hypothetical protein T4D_15310 [Trichinella pseudospiralis]